MADQNSIEVPDEGMSVSSTVSRHWQLRYEPRAWQHAALEKWRKNLKGVVQVVTGGGKTVFAQTCLLDFFERFPSGYALIVVPTISLLDQWCVALQDELNVSADQIGLLSGSEKLKADKPIVIAVINSARNFTTGFCDDRTVFLIVDECHRAGSPSNATALQGVFGATLGLSATPGREYDEGFESYIEPVLGPVIYEYSYKEAAQDGVISPFELMNVEVDMLSDEEEQYNRLSRRIGQARGRMKGDGHLDETILKRLLQQRAAVSASATMRIPVSVKLMERHRGERGVIFHERIDAANKILRILTQRGHRATIYHAGIGATIRRDNLRLFRKGVFDVLVCCRALDEGINVPEASVAVIASSTASSRQRIQRLGRILRRADGKDSATIYTLFATEEERRRLANEAAALEGITHIVWQQGRRKGDA